MILLASVALLGLMFGGMALAKGSPTPPKAPQAAFKGENLVFASSNAAKDQYGNPGGGKHEHHGGKCLAKGHYKDKSHGKAKGHSNDKICGKSHEQHGKAGDPHGKGKGHAKHDVHGKGHGKAKGHSKGGHGKGKGHNK